MPRSSTSPRPPNRATSDWRRGSPSAAFAAEQEAQRRVEARPPRLLGVLGAVLPLCPFIVAIQMYMATFAKSFKEAQSYMGLLIIIPMLPGVLASLYPISGKPWMYPLPIIAQQVLSADVVAAKPTPWWAFVVAAISAVILAFLLMMMTTRLLQRERIIFTR